MICLMFGVEDMDDSRVFRVLRMRSWKPGFRIHEFKGVRTEERKGAYAEPTT